MAASDGRIGTWDHLENRKKWFDGQPNKLRVIGKWLFLLLVCGYFSLSYASLPFFLNMNLYTQGLERTPFQYRVLPMFVFRLLMRTPLPIQIAAHFTTVYNDPYRVVMAATAFVCLLVAVMATAATIYRLTGDRIFAFWTSLLVILWAQLDLAYAWDNPFITPYDVPSLMFFAVAIYLVLRRNWLIYYPVFVLAVLNRETACFITVFFAIWQWFSIDNEGRQATSRLRWIVPQVFLQAAIWFVIKLLLAHRFAHNPEEDGGFAGGLFVTHFGYNVRELLKPQQWPLIASVCGFSLPFLWLQRRWIGVRGLASAIAIILPLSFAGLMIVGRVVEIRIFSDWIALVVPAVAMIVRNRFRPVINNATRD